ncbi:MAG: hypothetical protein ACRDVD_05380 [Acidimicrobiia bacterium]
MRGWKRILAWLIDWLWILVGLMGVLIFGLVFRTWEWICRQSNGTSWPFW